MNGVTLLGFRFYVDDEVRFYADEADLAEKAGFFSWLRSAIACRWALNKTKDFILPFPFHPLHPREQVFADLSRC